MNHQQQWDNLIDIVSKRMHEKTGNVFGSKQRPMLEARLRRHLRKINVSIENYPIYLQQNQALEDEKLIALLTTHFTSFFREFVHFEWLLKALPGIVKQAKLNGRKEIKILSAACSRGHEVWSLAMWMETHLKSIDPQMSWTIVGTDIDVESISVASNGVYHKKEIEAAPRNLWEPFWQRGRGEIADWMRVSKQLKSKCTFRVANLLKPSKAENEKYDIVFCRNVLIYFDTKNFQAVAENLLSKVYPDGFLVTGVSESLTHLNLKLKTIAPSVYSQATSETVLVSSTEVSSPKRLKVLCIDDSKTILNIFNKILNTVDIEVLSVASNGEEAINLLKNIKPDVITLDIHMPIMDGLVFLQRSNVAKDIPVVVVSSIERDNFEIVQPMFDLGVSDFVEKPTLENLSQISEELKQKIKIAHASHKSNSSDSNRKKREIVDSSDTLPNRTGGRIFIDAGLSDRNQIVNILNNTINDDEVFISLNSNFNISQRWVNSIQSRFPYVKLVDGFTDIKINSIKSSIMMLFKSGKNNIVINVDSKSCYIVLEEGHWDNKLTNIAHDMYPLTSFPYMVKKFLEGR
jgi:chemotaxis protein methyltransferase CheR